MQFLPQAWSLSLRDDFGKGVWSVLMPPKPQSCVSATEGKQARSCWRERNLTKHAGFIISAPGLDALLFPSSIPDLAECSKPTARQSMSKGISHNQNFHFQYLEISFPRRFRPSLRVKKLFCIEAIKIWQEGMEKLWNILNLGSGFGDLKRNL